MNKQILLIDDDVDELYIFNEALSETSKDIKCMLANSIEEGFKILNKKIPDFIFLDINMPRVNGFEALAVIKNTKFFSEVPVIMYSTAINEDVTKKALSLGAAACVKKTDSVKSLASILMRLLDGDF